MRRSTLMAAAFAVSLAAATLAQPEDGGRPGRRRPRAGRPGRPAAIGRILEELGFSDAQKEQLRSILADHRDQAEQNREKIREHMTKARELREALAKAIKAGDTAAAEKLQKDLEALRAEAPRPMDALLDEIAKICTDDQKARLAQIRQRMGRGTGEPGRPRRLGPAAVLRLADELGLSDEQKAKVEQIVKSFGEKMRELGRDATREQRADLHQKVMDDIHAVLSDEQKARLKELLARRRGPAGRGLNPRALHDAVDKLDLTAEQRTSIAALFERFRESVRELGADDRDGRRELIRKLGDDVMAQLTPEQKEKLRAARQQRRGEGRQDGEGRPRGGQQPRRRGRRTAG